MAYYLCHILLCPLLLVWIINGTNYPHEKVKIFFSIMSYLAVRNKKNQNKTKQKRLSNSDGIEKQKLQCLSFFFFKYRKYVNIRVNKVIYNSFTCHGMALNRIQWGSSNPGALENVESTLCHIQDHSDPGW